MDLDPIDVKRLDIPAQLPDLRRDIHVFVNYVREREVKRNHRDNGLSKADTKRLTQLLSDRHVADEDDTSPWLDFVDDIALELGFVEYDTKGEYAGYTSANPSFPDNYIKFCEKEYQRFCALKAARQEATLLELLLERRQESNSEFYRRGVFGRLDSFQSWGSAIGVVPTLDFAAARRFLLNLLAECPPGQWLSTASLVEYLKKHHRYFLIPKKPQYKHPRDAQGGRYGNFHESKKDAWGHEIDIAEREEDAFERVEGRYVERFLEGIPLLLRYVDVAYAKSRPKGVYPSRGWLQAFRVSERLRRALASQIPEPKVTVTPDFDVYVQAEFYPAGVLPQLVPLCELVSDDTSIVLKLQKQKVAAACAADPKLDVPVLLRRLSDRDLPANVARELSEWSQHGDKFVLYADACVLEADPDLEGRRPVHRRAGSSADTRGPFAEQAVRRVGASRTHAVACAARRQSVLPLATKRADSISKASGGPGETSPAQGSRDTAACNAGATAMPAPRISGRVAADSAGGQVPRGNRPGKPHTGLFQAVRIAGDPGRSDAAERLSGHDPGRRLTPNGVLGWQRRV